MDTLFVYLAKSSAVALLFLLSYMVLLRKETFFVTNRIYLLLGLVVSFILPSITFTKTVWVNPQPVITGNFTIIDNTATTTESPFIWLNILLAIYLIGVVFFGVRLLAQLLSIKKIKSTSTVIHERDIKHVQAKRELSPFSFFKNIFYCPSQFKENELNAIIAHEKVHARQHHSIDVLFIQVVCILFWFNPLVWLYKSYIKQNLEFLADSNALKRVSDKKQYQYLMLQQAVGGQNMAITNSFYNSLTRPILGNGIKKRITMLHQNQSRKMNFLKLFIILPVLAVFLLAFNTKTEYKTKNAPETAIAPQGKSFEYLINKTTSNNQLELIKNELKEKGIDFSYTTVRNDNGEIIDIQLDANGKDDNGVDFNLNYDSNTNKPIEEVLMTYDGKNSSFFIGKKSKKGQLESESATKIARKIIQTKKKIKEKISSVTIEVDKDSKTENLKKDSEFLAERGVKIDFKGIKRNNTNEITAIKVVYDNGKGDKGKYQQNSSEAITPFKIAVTFNEDGMTTIDILGKENMHKHSIHNNKAAVWLSDDGEKIIEIKPHGKHKNVWISSESENSKIIEIDGEGNHTMIWSGLDEIGEHKDIKVIVEDGEEKIFLNGEEVTKDELEDMEFDIRINEDEENGDVKVHVITEEDIDDKKIKIRQHKVKGGKVVIDMDTDIDEEENVFVIKTDEDGKHHKSVKIIADDSDALIIIDGKESTHEEMKKLSPEEIKQIDVSKGEAAIKKYGEKAKNGVVEIITKKGN